MTQPASSVPTLSQTSYGVNPKTSAEIKSFCERFRNFFTRIFSALSNFFSSCFRSCREPRWVNEPGATKPQKETIIHAYSDPFAAYLRQSSPPVLSSNAQPSLQDVSINSSNRQGPQSPPATSVPDNLDSFDDLFIEARENNNPSPQPVQDNGEIRDEDVRELGGDLPQPTASQPIVSPALREAISTTNNGPVFATMNKEGHLTPLRVKPKMEPSSSKENQPPAPLENASKAIKPQQKPTGPKPMDNVTLPALKTSYAEMAARSAKKN